MKAPFFWTPLRIIVISLFSVIALWLIYWLVSHVKLLLESDYAYKITIRGWVLGAVVVMIFLGIYLIQRIRRK